MFVLSYSILGLPEPREAELGDSLALAAPISISIYLAVVLAPPNCDVASTASSSSRKMTGSSSLRYDANKKGKMTCIKIERDMTREGGTAGHIEGC